MSSEKKEYRRSPLCVISDWIKDTRWKKVRDDIGKILTIIDGVIVDKEQKKAVKDLIHNVFIQETYHWKNVEEMLGIFKDKYCPNIEDGYDVKLKRLDKNQPMEEIINFN